MSRSPAISRRKMTRAEMRRRWLIMTAAVLALVIVLALLRSLARRAIADFFYPSAPVLPAAVPDTAEVLLARYEKILRDRAPLVLAATQPGLTNAQIDALEKTHHVTLPHDLRALYRWRNGTPHASDIDVFADHRFIPLEEALAKPAAMKEQLNSLGLFPRLITSTLLAYRESWLEVAVDVAGDGYFFDPDRSESEGSFFFCFTEDHRYVFFPAFRNFLAATVEGHETGSLGFGPQGATTLDFPRALKLWERYAATNL